MSGQKPWEPWADDPESFERAVLANLEPKLRSSFYAYLIREPAGREFDGVHLEGSYPHTAIVVSYLDLETGRVEEERRSVWDEAIDAGGTIDPESLAEELWILLIP